MLPAARAPGWGPPEMRGLTMRYALGALAAFCLSSAYLCPAVAQTTGDQGAGSLVRSNPVPPIGNPAVIVPGAGGNFTNLENFGNSPEAMPGAGSAAGRPGTTFGDLFDAAGKNTPPSPITNNDDWLKRSMDMLRNPDKSVLGEIDAEAGRICTEVKEQVTKSETSLYTCETGSTVSEEGKVCLKTYQPIYDEDYVYQCRKGEEWSKQTRTCEPERIVEIGDTYVYTCRVGVKWIDTPASCERRRVVEVDEDYVYECRQGARYQTDVRVCEPERVVVVDEDTLYECKVGTDWTHTPSSCERRRVVVVKEDYGYLCQETWNGGGHAPSQGCQARGSAACVAQGARVCVQPSGLPAEYTCQQGHQGSIQNSICSIWDSSSVNTYNKWRIEVFDMTQQIPAGVSKYAGTFPGCTISDFSSTVGGEFAVGINSYFTADCGGRGLPPQFIEEPGWYWYWSTHFVDGGGFSIPMITYYARNIGTSNVIEQQTTDCQVLSSNPSCQQTGQTCVEGGGIRNINGVDVYRACWKYSVNYTCGSQTPYPGCNAPAGMQLASEQCIATNAGGACTGTQRRYVDPSDGCFRYDQGYRCSQEVSGAGVPVQTYRDVVSESWEGNCSALASNSSCRKDSETVVEGWATKIINGLAVTRDPWLIRENYTCSSASAANTCGPYQACRLTAQVCVSQDPNGNCSSYSRTYRCDNPPHDGGTPIGKVQEVVGEYWTDPCVDHRADSSCKQVDDRTLIGNETRVINGLSVTRDPWKRRVTFQCTKSEGVDTCAPVKGCERISSSCVANAPDGSCAEQAVRYRCEGTVPGAGEPVEVVRDIIGEYWESNCQALENNPTCKKDSETVLVGNQTRIINGLPVTRNPWEVRDNYTCRAEEAGATCAPYQKDCTLLSETCSTPQAAGAQCPGYDRKYQCITPAGPLPPASTMPGIIREYWTDPCSDLRNNGACTKTGESILIGNQTRVISGLQITRDPWRKLETYSCDVSNVVDTCAVVRGCDQISTECGGRAPNGSCSIEIRRYRCEDPHPGAGEPVETPIDQVGGELTGPACDAEQSQSCERTASVCTQPGGTRIINGVPTTADCWERTDTYRCEAYSPPSSNCEPKAGCELTGKHCLEDVADDKCRTWENIYTCKTTKVEEETRTRCETNFCVGGLCSKQEDSPNSDMPDALAALMIGKQAGFDYERDMTIFNGTAMRCRKAVLGFRNCCKDSGWGVDMGLTQCSQEEQTLMTRQEAKSVHYVGTYCSQKSFFGVCLEKSMRYCAFEGTLAKIVHEQGRPQIGKGWGEPKNADCSGFTVDQFQQLDLTNVDFSEFTNDMMKKITSPDPNSTISRIQQSIQGLMGSNTPGIGDRPEAGDDNP